MDAQSVIDRIDKAYEESFKEKPRKYLGASIVGNPCDALLSFNLRGFPNDPPDARLQRVFRMGHILEDEVVKDLKKAGLSIFEVDGVTGKQHTYSALGGHIVCHTDGLAEDEDGSVMVLEIKSMNEASHKKFLSKGVRISHPQYYGQVQLEMGLSEIHSTLFVAICKNNSMYGVEIVEFDEIEFAFIRERVQRVIDGDVEKISSDKTDWRCKGCFKRSVCWDNREPKVECATCQHATATHGKEWYCNIKDTTAVNPCDKYEIWRPRER